MLPINEINFGQKLILWKQYAEGNKKIRKKDEQQIVANAMEDLVKIKDQFREQIQRGRVSQIAIWEVCNLVDSIERVVKGINFGENGALSEAVASVRYDVLNSDVEEFHPKCVIEQFQKFLPSDSALDCLIGIKAFPILAQACNITNRELMNRCFINAGLSSVQDLIDLCNENSNEKNVMKIIKDRLDKSREEACAKMDPRLLKSFNHQWNGYTHRDFIYEKKIRPLDRLGNPKKIDACDFIKKASFCMELKHLPQEEQFLKHTLLYKGEKEDFFLILPYEVLSDKYLWSPDGKTFYVMHSKSSGESSDNGYIQGFDVSLEHKEEKSNVSVRIGGNQVYSILEIQKDVYATYERQNLETMRQVLASYKSGAIQIVPLQVARKPEYLFKMQNGDYIYVDSIIKDDYDFKVYICSNGNIRNPQVLNVERQRDGGSTLITIAGNEKIHSKSKVNPDIIDRTPTFTDSAGVCHPLEELDTEKFDYKTIGIELEAMNPRPTMLYLYQ